ncbi:MAG: hypothetical protein ACJAU0_002074 [Flavobacteriales bacterium]
MHWLSNYNTSRIVYCASGIVAVYRRIRLQGRSRCIMEVVISIRVIVSPSVIPAIVPSVIPTIVPTTIWVVRVKAVSAITKTIPRVKERVINRTSPRIVTIDVTTSEWIEAIEAKMSTTPRVESNVPARSEYSTWVVKSIALIVAIIIIDYCTIVIVVIVFIIVIVRIRVVCILRRI